METLAKILFGGSMRKIRINQIEEYKDIRPYYWIDEFGTCWNENTGKKLKYKVSGKTKYPKYTVRTIDNHYKNIYIHKILAQAFIPNPNNLSIVRHLNDNKDDWRLENLVWGTLSDNIQDCIKNGGYKNGGYIQSRSVRCIETGVIYKSVIEARRQTNIDDSSISKCCRGIYKTSGGYHWEYVEEV